MIEKTSMKTRTLTGHASDAYLTKDGKSPWLFTHVDLTLVHRINGACVVVEAVVLR